MIWLSKDQVLLIYRQLMKATGGSAGIRDDNLLDSAIGQPMQTFGDSDLYPSITEKAVRLGFGIIMNHPFVDGNKRIGAHAMLLTLKLNGIESTYTQDELIDIILHVASGQKDYAALLEWANRHTI